MEMQIITQNVITVNPDGFCYIFCDLTPQEKPDMNQNDKSSVPGRSSPAGGSMLLQK